MAGYDKITVKDFSKKLDDDGYSSLTGAKRAIGRMTTWTENQRNKARSIAAKHFGEEDLPPAVKKTSKKTKKKAVKRSARKKGLAASPTKKAVKKKKAAKKSKTLSAKPPTPSPTSSKAKAKKSSGLKKTKAKAGAASSTRQPTIHDKLEEANAKTDAMRNVLDQVERTRSLGAPETEVAADAKKAQAGLSRIIDEICALTERIVNEPSVAEKEAAGDFAKAARASRPGGNGVTTTTTTPAAPTLPAVTPPPATV